MEGLWLQDSQAALGPDALGGFGANPLCPHPLRPLERVGHRTRKKLQQLVAEGCPAVPGVYGMLDRAGDFDLRRQEQVAASSADELFH